MFTTNSGAITITGYSGRPIDVTIPSETNGFPVTSSGDYAFISCLSLANVSIPGSVTNIGPSAFFYCASLTNATLANGLTTIGNGAFYACSSMTTITIPASVTSIGQFAFSSCANLTNVFFQDNASAARPHLRAVWGRQSEIGTSFAK